MYTIVDNNFFSGSFVVPEIGDPITAASVRPAFQALGDRTRFLYNPVTSSSGHYPLATRSVTRFGRDMGTPVEPDKWTRDNRGILETTVSSSVACWFPLEIPHGATLTKVGVYIEGGGGHIGWGLPSNMPNFSVYEESLVIADPFPSYNASASIIVNVVSDVATNETVYEQVHPITSSILNVTIDNQNKAYRMLLNTESGNESGTANGANSGTKVYWPFVTYTISELDDD